MKTCELRLGLYDDTARQRQPEYTADLYTTHLAVFGEFGKGKRTLLEQAVLQLHLCQADRREEIHILSFGSRLAALAQLPLVASYTDGADTENVRRIFRLLIRRLESGRKQLAGRRFADCEETGTSHSAAEQGAAAAGAPAHITFVIEGVEKLYAADDPQSEKHRELLTRIAREGLAAGISLIVSADSPAGGVQRLLGHGFRRVIAFSLTSAEGYPELFGHRVREPLPLPGRGLALLGRQAVEFQAYQPWPSPQQREDFFRRLSGQLAARTRHPVQKLKVLSGELTQQSWPDFCSEAPYAPGAFTAGLDYEKVQPVRIDLRRAGAIALTGKRSSGKSNLLRGILHGALGIAGAEFILYETGRAGLQELLPLFENTAAPHRVRDFGALLQLLDPDGAQTAAAAAPPLQSFAAPALPRFDFGALLTAEVPAPGVIGQGAASLVQQEPPVSGQEPFAQPAAQTPSGPAAAKPHRAPFTVAVIQTDRMDPEAAAQLLPLAQTAAENDLLLIFADVRPHSPAAPLLLGGRVPYVFVLDNIVHFAQNSRGCFGEMDLSWLKEQFGTAAFFAGEGFLYDVDGDELTRFKALLQPDTP